MRRLLVRIGLGVLLAVSAIPPAVVYAAITITQKIFEGTTTNGTTFTTAATWSVTLNTLGLCAIGMSDSVTPSVISITQTGQTWTAVDATNALELFDTIATPQSRLQVFRTLGAGATAAAIVVDGSMGTGDQTGFSVMCAEFSDIDTSGSNGSGAIIQAVDGSQDSTPDITTTVAARTANSALVQFVMAGSVDCIYTADVVGGFALANTGTPISFVTPNTTAIYQSVVGGTDAAPLMDQAICGTPNVSAIAVEVKAAGAAAATGPSLGTFNLLEVGR